MSSLEFDLNVLQTIPLFNNIINSLHDGVLIADQEAHVIYVNTAYLRLTGVTSLEVLGKKVQDVRKGARLPEVLNTGKPLLGIRRKVNEIEYIVDISPISLDDKVIGAISVVRDITEIAELSNKLKDYSHKVLELDKKVREIHQVHYSFDDIIGRSKEIETTKGMARRAAANNVPVLILGESGSGKELFAHAIHDSSPRSGGPFVPINCAAFPPHLLSSELFGYEEGAFTGASKGGKLGLFEIANGGTLFLDEIGDMDLDLQSKLLRVLEAGEFMRIGGTKTIQVKVRIISATNKDLEKLIREERFRKDLFYRLNVIFLKIPPLRVHLDDIPLLVEHYLKKLSARLKTKYTIAEEAVALLCQHHYPGNIRELFNILEFAANTCDTQKVMPNDLPIYSKIKHPPGLQGTLSNAIKASEREAIMDALGNFGGSVEGKRKAAKHLGISLATLYNKVRQYDI